ncbi:MAG TPA: RimK family alpha-L-glutamate ligase [Planctomycetaceae bacterium]|jgi:ribosomal protein S6--L-glutamate ligase|nr:RimK family alpha-L-glutamate ligase [Planctomycetaceae bacterium]
MKIAILAKPRSWYCRDLSRAAAERGHRSSRIDFPKIVACVGGVDPAVVAGEADLTAFDAVIVRTMPPGSLEQVVYRMDALWRLSAAGVTVLNPPKAVECAVDKYLASARLEQAGLAVPPTVVCEDANDALAAFERLGGDVVVKPIFGSEGRGIVRVSDREIALRTFRTLERIGSVVYVQRFIENEGFDVRVLVLDGRVLGAMRRRANGDFRANVSCRGTAEIHSVTDREAQCSLTAAQATEARFAGVDLLYGRDGTCYVIEVNAVPGWQAFRRVTGIDVAAAVIARLEAGL